MIYWMSYSRYGSIGLLLYFLTIALIVYNWSMIKAIICGVSLLLILIYVPPLFFYMVGLTAIGVIISLALPKRK